VEGQGSCRRGGLPRVECRGRNRVEAAATTAAESREEEGGGGEEEENRREGEVGEGCG
jgi:hypothetical protein